MTKKELAESLKRAKEIASGREARYADCIARAYGYLERAVEEFVGHIEREEIEKLARHGIKYR